MSAKRWIIGFLIMGVLLLAMPAIGQSDCGEGLPCGAIPWALPVLPILPSPTQFPTVVVTQTPSPTPLAITPGVPTDEPTEFIDIENLEDQVATLTALMEATEEVLVDADGGAFDEESVDLTGNATELFGYVRAVGNVHLGVFTPIVGFLVFGLIFTFANEILFFIVPIGAAIFGFIRKVLTLIMDFLPF